jgi:hypothetical protein
MPVIEIQDGAHRAKVMVSEGEYRCLKRGDRFYLPTKSDHGGTLVYRFAYIEELHPASNA